MADRHHTSRSFPTELLPVRAAHLLVDMLLFATAFTAAYLIRFEGDIPAKSFDQMTTVLPYLVLARMAVYTATGSYRIVWRYVGTREAVHFAKAVAVVSLPLLALRLLWPEPSLYLKLPIGIILLEAVLVFLGTAGARFLRRLHHERRLRTKSDTSSRKRTLLIGAGNAGLAIAKEALRAPELGVNPVGFLDDDPAKAGMDIHGLRVLGPLHNFEWALAKTSADQVFITTRSIPSAEILKIVNLCREEDLDVRILPNLYEILGSGAGLQMLREVQIDDLLARDPIEPSLSVEDLTDKYSEKTVMVTGAGGSIGSELCRQLLLMKPKKLLLVERDENNLFEIDRELARTDGANRRLSVLLDISERRGVERLFKQHRPDVIFHAAAYKHVPMMESFPAAAVLNNTFGTSLLLEAASQHQCEHFILISTDKAVNPSSVMGATKRFAELLVQQTGERCAGSYSCVRFGNVLGSRGSVVGIFREQIRSGGPVTVTHPDATRYFMTIQEAVNLVLQAGTLDGEGDVFLLDMGTPVRILDLAKQMIRLSGFGEHEIPIKLVGFRPGEKLFEELNLDSDEVRPSQLRKIHRVTPGTVPEEKIAAVLDRLNFLVRSQDHEGVREALKELDIGYGTVGIAN